MYIYVYAYRCYVYIYKDIYKVFLICCLIEKIIDKNQFDELLLEFNSTPIHELPINASILMKHGFQGAEIGKNLKECEKLWLESDCSFVEEELLELIIH